MSHLLPNQRGAGHIVALLAIVVIGVAGFVGYRVMNADDKNKDTAQTQTEVPATLQSSADIDKASSSLEELDTSIDESKLDEDLNSLL